MKNKDNAKKRRIENPIRFFYPTSDDWYPNFPRDTVEIALYVYYTFLDPKDGLIRIVVRGADDCYLEKDYHLHSSQYDLKVKELSYWLDHKLPNPLTKIWLKEQGFSVL